MSHTLNYSQIKALNSPVICVKGYTRQTDQTDEKYFDYDASNVLTPAKQLSERFGEEGSQVTPTENTQLSGQKPFKRHEIPFEADRSAMKP